MGVYSTTSIESVTRRKGGGGVGKDPKREDLGHVKCSLVKNFQPSLVFGAVWLQLRSIKKIVGGWLKSAKRERF